MTVDTCLRCDWQGETRGPRCPNCGEQPIYVIGASPSQGAEMPVGARPLEPSWEVPNIVRMAPSRSSPLQSHPSPIPTDAVGSSSRSARSRSALVLAALVLIATLSTWFVLATRSGENAPTPAQEPMVDPATVATDFLQAYGAFDAEEAISYLASDADITGLIGSGVEGAPDNVGLLISWLEAEGYKQTLGPCEARTFASETSVRCTFDFHALGSYEIGRGPYTGSYFNVTVRDGEIVRASTHWDIAKFSPQMWEPFDRWVSKAYPKDAAVMYADESHSDARLTEESIRLWERRSRGYVEIEIPKMVEVAESFMDARNAYDADKAMSLLAGRGAAVRLGYNNRIIGDMPIVQMDRDELALALEAERLYGVRYGSVGCRPGPDRVGRDGAQVICTYLMDNKLRQIAGYAPTESSFAIRVRNGCITYLSFPWLNFSFPSGSPAEGWRFVRWLKAKHPEAGGPMHRGKLFQTMGQELVLILTRESIDLLAGYLAEYEQSVTG